MKLQSCPSTLVKIELIDFDKRLSSCIDAMGRVLDAKFYDSSNGSLTIPKQGEVWVAKFERNSWHLDSRADLNSKLFFEYKRRIEAKGSEASGDTLIVSDGELVIADKHGHLFDENSPGKINVSRISGEFPVGLHNVQAVVTGFSGGNEVSIEWPIETREKSGTGPGESGITQIGAKVIATVSSKDEVLWVSLPSEIDGEKPTFMLGGNSRVMRELDNRLEELDTALDVLGEELRENKEDLSRLDLSLDENIQALEQNILDLEGAKQRIEESKLEIDRAVEAIAIADGRVTTSRFTPTTEDGEGKPTNALWYVYSEDGTNLVSTYMWNGTSWVPYFWDSTSLAPDSITATSGVIANAAIVDAMIRDLNAAKITSGYIETARLKAGSITADRLVVTETENLHPDPTFSREDMYTGLESSGMSLACVSTTVGSVTHKDDTRVLVTGGDKLSLSFNVGFSGDTSGSSAGINMEFYGDIDQRISRYENLYNTSGKKQSVVSVPQTAKYILVENAFYSGNTSSKKITLSNPSIRRLVGTTLIEDGAVTTDKVYASAITADKIATDAITANKIASGVITADHLGADSVHAEHIQAGAVTSQKIDAGAVTAEKIQADTITSREIATKAITARELAVGALTTENLNIAVNYENLIPGAEDLVAEFLAGNNGAFQNFGINTEDPSIWLQGRKDGWIWAQIPVVAGERYRWSVDVKGSVSGTVFYIQTLTANSDGSRNANLSFDAWTDWKRSPNAGSSSTSYPFLNTVAGTEYESYWVEATATTSGVISLYIWANHTDGTTNNEGYQWFRNLRFYDINSGLKIYPVDGKGGTVLNGREIGMVSEDGEGLIRITPNDGQYMTFSREGTAYFSVSDSGDVSGEVISANDSFYYRGTELTELLETMPRGLIYTTSREDGPHKISYASYISRLAYILAQKPETDRMWRIWATYDARGNGSTSSDSWNLWVFAFNGGRHYNQTTWQTISQGRQWVPGISDYDQHQLVAEVRAHSLPWSDDGSGIFSINMSNVAGSSFNVRNVFFWIDDVGKPVFASPSTPWIRPEVGSDVAPTPAEQRHTSTWNMSGFQNYLSGARVNHASGNIAGGNFGGEWRGIMLFPHTPIRSALSGATTTKVEIYLHNAHTYASSGSTVLIGSHNYASAPASSPAVAARASQHFGRGQGRWVTLPTAVGAGFANGTIKGIAVYGGSTANYATWTPSAPKLRISYKK